MYRRFSVKTSLISLFAVFAVVPNAQAQLLTGYDDRSKTVSSKTQPVTLTAPDSYESILTSPAALVVPEVDDVLLPEPEEKVFSPLMTAHVDVPKVSHEYPIVLPEKTNSYTPLLTGKSKEDLKPEREPLDIEADTMRYDDAVRVVSAEGDVIIVQDGRILRADEVEYLLDQDSVRAKGNVVLNEESGDIHLAQDVTYSNRLKDGTIDDLKTILNDGSRFKAEKGRREGGTLTTMEDASYTACEPCKKYPERAPVWSINASEVIHDKEEARVSYKNAYFDVYGVPVAYTPYFSHPDGTIKRKSGFLSPSFGYKSDLGAFIQNDYYWSIAPDKDMTFGLLAMTEQAPLGLLEYRQRWQNAGLKINGGLTYSDRTDEEDGVNVRKDEEIRGHIFAEGLWDINEKWRSGLDIEYATDDQYVRQYDITSEDVLRNKVYAERFSGRNYGIGFVELYQDTRISERQVDQPGILPEVYASFIGEPGAVPLVKGRWDATFDLLSLFREGEDQDVVRGSLDLGWKRRLVSDYGLVTDMDLTLRGDVYHIEDADSTTTTFGEESDSFESRFFPQFHIQSSYPVARNFENAQLIIEPLVAVTASMTNNSNEDIPNEDSQDVQLDASNLFEANRFPGLDVVEDQSRVTYGLRAGLNGYESGNVEFFVGQNYRFDDEDIPFQSGSGLNAQSSDVVGYVRGDIGSRYSMQYRFQLNNETLASERHEFDASADWNRFRLSSNYLYAEPIEGTEITESREQLSATAQYYFNKNWRLLTQAQYDLGSDPGLRKGSLGLDYFGQCVSWSLLGKKTLTDDSSGDSDTEVVFRIGLKNISEFMRSGLRDEGNSP